MGLIERGARALPKESISFMQAEPDALLVSSIQESEAKPHPPTVCGSVIQVTDFGASNVQRFYGVHAH